MKKKFISIIIPTLNEEGNIVSLVGRIADIFKESPIYGEIIFIDDHSTDSTCEIICKMKERFRANFPIRVFLKKGKQGKAQSLIEGFRYAKYDLVAMIDGDLQYPPEAIVEMVEKISCGADIVVANRREHEISRARLFLSKSFNLVFARLLHGLNCDVQSGLKIFKKTITNEVILDPTPWTFDMEFLLSAQNIGYVIDTVEIKFSERISGKSKIKVIGAVFDIGWNAIKLKFKNFEPFRLAPTLSGTMLGAGVAHKRTRFVTHSTLHHDFTALNTFSVRQKNLLISALVIFILGIAFNLHATAVILLAFINAVYFFDIVFNLSLVLKSLSSEREMKFSINELKEINDDILPIYTILCPLYKEANMIEHFVRAMEKIHWPKNKMEVLLLLEENDHETIKTARLMKLPYYIKIIVVPHSLPKTKPKACNYGLAHARGKFVVIYDAEDIPDPWQLKKAYLGFQTVETNVICLQAKLNYFNPHQNFLTRLFTAEYSLWFDIVLPGLQSINTSIPLGGTSNHFVKKELIRLKGWDPFNVTEDCDLGARLFLQGHKTSIIDSITLEEANSSPKNWLRQRSRWIKGYMQTYLVHMRKPWKFIRKHGWHALIFQLVVGGKITFMIINPIFWAMTILYFAFYETFGSMIHSLFPPAVFYTAVISMVFGNFLHLYYYMIGCAKRGHYRLIKFVFLVPFYWFMASTAAVIAAYQLFFKPHYWEKTIHGLHFGKMEKTSKILFMDTNSEAIPAAVYNSKFQQKIFIFRKNVKNIKKNFIVNISLKKRNFEKKLTSIFPKNFGKFIFSSQAVLIVAMIMSNLLNFTFTVFLARSLSYPQIALVILMSTMWSIATIFIGGFAGTINHKTAYLIGRNENDRARSFLSWSLRRGKNLILVFSCVWVMATPMIADFFQIKSVWIFVLFVPAILFGLISNTYDSFFKGNFRFHWSAIIILVESFSKLFFAIALAIYSKGEWVFLAIPLSLMASAFVGALFLRNIPRQVSSEKNYQNKFPFNFFLSSVLTNISSIVFLSLDILLVKHFFSDETVGQYSILSSAGKMIYFLGTLPLVFMIPYVSLKDGMRQQSKNIFRNIFSSVLILVAASYIILGVFGFFSVPFLFGSKSLAIVEWLPSYSLAISIFTLANAIVVYYLAKRNYKFPTISMGSSLALIFGIWFWHDSLSQVVQVFSIVSFATFLLVVLLHYLEKNLVFFRRVLIDFWGIISNGLPKTESEAAAGRRILIFNWRDITHSFAGGAETYVHEVAKTWVRQGNHVTLFCGNDGKQPRYEIIDGIDIVRRGGFYLVYVWAFLYYIFRFRNKYDVVIDCENGIPFFTPLYVRKPIFSLLHHVHQDVFFHSLSLPLAKFASFLEKDLMPLVYKKIKFITVSDSSRQEMENIGIGAAGISVVNPGINPEEFSTIISEKTEHPTILYLGRLKAYKSVNILIHAFFSVVAKFPDARLIIAGKGSEEYELKKLIHQLNFTEQQVSLVGKVSEREKVKLLQSSWVLVNPSMMEGWGIVAIEASACGTPVIASNVPGLRDSVHDGKGGYLLPYGDVVAFSKAIMKIIQDRERRQTMEKYAKNWAENFTWEKTSAALFSLISEE